MRKPFFDKIQNSTVSSLLHAVSALACLALPNVAPAQTSAGEGMACLELVEALATDGRVTLQGVSFDFNRSTLRPDSLPALIAARDAILTLGGDWEIEGHTDNVGSRIYNQNLSEARAMAVRDWLVSAGVPAEQLAAQGFSFDRPIVDNSTDAGRAQNRRVELVGGVAPDRLGFGGPDGVNPCPDTLISGGVTADIAAPPIPDWSGAGGQEWLPFSGLMPTGFGGVSGWGGERSEMPPGARPEACQALCTANSDCAAFSFEPAGSHFVENARCALIGYGTELNLTRDNSYYDGGTFYVSGLKPDARLLTSESEVIAQEIIADLAEIARLRETVRIIAPDSHLSESWMDLAVEGAVPGGDYPTYLEIALPGDYAFDWRNSKSSLFIHDMPDGRSGQIWVPEPGEYVLRYVINHPTAGQHTITEQSFVVLAKDGATAAAADATASLPVRSGTVEPGIDRPGMDIGQTPIGAADPLICQALCADDPNCKAWSYVEPGHQGDKAICWTKSDVPDGFSNDCCTSGVMDQAARSAPTASTDSDTASLSFPTVVTPEESISITYRGPLNAGDWVDIITHGNDDDMSGGWSWAYVTGEPVSLIAPASEGDYSLRYVAEDPVRGRIVLVQETLSVRIPQSDTGGAIAIVQRCDGTKGPFCEVVLPANDVSMTLAAGYGLTEPLVYETAGGARGERPSFDVIRLSDGEAVILVNARQAQTVYCQTGTAGDEICLTSAFNDGDASLAGGLFSSLTSIALQAETADMGDNVEAGSPAGDLQGVWFFQIDAPGTPEDQIHFVVADLMQDAGDLALQGSFTTAPDVGPLQGLSGDLAGVIAGDTLNLTMTGPDGVTGLVFTGTQYGADAYRGTVDLAHAPLTPPVGAIIRKVAGPGEDWDGPAWARGDADGMAAAMQVGQQALQGIFGNLEGEDRAMVEMMGEMMGAMAGVSASASQTTPSAPSPEMTALGGLAIDGLGADDALFLLAPYSEERP